MKDTLKKEDKELLFKKIFSVTASIVQQITDDTYEYDSWGSKTVKRVTEQLLANFKEEKEELHLLCNELKIEKINFLLAFKVTESHINDWIIELDSKGWWSSSVRTRSEKISRSLANEKKEFIANML